MRNICSFIELHTKIHQCTLCAEGRIFFNVKPRGTVPEVITKLLRANKYRKFSYYQSTNMVEHIQYIIQQQHSTK